MKLSASSSSNSRWPHNRCCPSIWKMPLNSGKVTPPFENHLIWEGKDKFWTTIYFLRVGNVYCMRFLQKKNCQIWPWQLLKENTAAYRGGHHNLTFIIEPISYSCLWKYFLPGRTEKKVDDILHFKDSTVHLWMTWLPIGNRKPNQISNMMQHHNLCIKYSSLFTN